MKFLVSFPAVSVVALVSVGFSASCVSPAAVSPDPIAEACGGERPATITECRGGVFWGDCGGEGGPILACHESGGRCAWFSHGCAPVGFHATDCPIGDPCCESTSDGSWPFAKDWRPATPMAVVELEEDIAAMGYAPVTASSPAGVIVTVDSSWVPAAPGVSCDGPGADLLQVCGRPLLLPGAGMWGNTILVVFRTFGIEDWLFLEIVPEAETGTGAPIARTFVRFQDDAAPPDVPLSCERAQSPRLDLTGTLTINGIDVANPTAMHGHLVLNLPGGGHATADF